MTKDCVEESYETMNGMPLNCEWSDEWFSNPAWALIGHDTRFTIGYVTETWIDENKLMAKGIIWQDNYYDVAYMLTNARPALGFSVEANVTYEYKEDKYYSKSVVFTGLATLWKESAAWGDTQLLSLVANRINNSKEKDDVNMTPEEMKAMFLEFSKGLTEEISKVQASVDQKFEALEEQKKAEEAAKLEAAKKTEDDAAAELEKLKAANAELQTKLEAAAKAIPAPTATQTAAPKEGELNVSAEFAKINASKEMSFDEKLKARFAIALAAQE